LFKEEEEEEEEEAEAEAETPNHPTLFLNEPEQKVVL